MASYSIDTSSLPLLRITYRGRVSDSEFRAHLTEFERVLGQGSRFAAVFDALEAEPLNPSQRRMKAEFLRVFAGGLAHFCVGGAFAIRDPEVHRAWLATSWRQELPFEHTVVGTLREATRWARTQLRIVGVRDMGATVTDTPRGIRGL